MSENDFCFGQLGRLFPQRGSAGVEADCVRVHLGVGCTGGSSLHLYVLR